MKYEKLNDSNSKKMFLYGVVITLILVVIINIFLTRAKYKVVDSVKLAEGTVNYTVADLNVIAMYKNDGNGNEIINSIPDGNYELSSESYCVVGNNEERLKDNISFDKTKVSIDITKKGTKCYIYFNRIYTPEEVLANLGIKETSKTGETEFTGIATVEDSGLYSGEDDYGTTYYYRGNINNNWVKFGKTRNNQDIYWHIIRINGNGTIRLIYSGIDSAQETGEETQINGSTGVAFNTKSDDNKYVGYMYDGIEESPSISYSQTMSDSPTQSTILREIESWYNGTDGYSTSGFDATNYGKYLDGATGFCNDREVSDTARKWWNGEDAIQTNLGWGTHATAYAPFYRIMTISGGWGNSQTPTFNCGNPERDLFTMSGKEKGDGNGKLPVPVGLITADEVIFAGGFGGSSNGGYWLYTGQCYWTMSAKHWSNNFAWVYSVKSDGSLDGPNVDDPYGVRPVINLKASTNFSGGTGDKNSPFIVATK